MPIVFFPHRRYLIKTCLGAVVSLPFQWVFLAFALNSLPNTGLDSFLKAFFPLMLASSLFWLGAAVLVYRNIRYEITEDEIVVYSGVLNKSIKHVPFRTITNMQVTRGFWDRVFQLGTLEIQTAGTGGTKAEEQLVGLDDVQGAYEYVANVLRGFRGTMSPTQAGQDTPGSRQSTSEREILVHILNELRAIRKELHQANQSVSN